MFEKFIMVVIVILLVLLVWVVAKPVLLDQKNLATLTRVIKAQNDSLQRHEQDIGLLKDKLVPQAAK